MADETPTIDVFNTTDAVLAGDGDRCLSVLRPVFMPPMHAPSREVFDALPRHPVSGRPVVQ